MKKIPVAAVTLGIILGAATHLQAADYSTKQRIRHARAHHRSHAIATIVVASAPKFCYYMGGPHGAPWVCR